MHILATVCHDQSVSSPVSGVWEMEEPDVEEPDMQHGGVGKGTAQYAPHHKLIVVSDRKLIVVSDLFLRIFF